MKRTFVIALFAVATLFTVASCTATRGGGCKGTQGFIGYGSR